MAAPGQPFDRGRLVLVLFGAAVGAVAAWLLLTPRPEPVNVTIDAPAVPEQPIAVWLARADAARGEALFARCAPCHQLAEGGAHGVGPNLWGVTGGPIATRPGYRYSNALAGHGGRWDWENASRFIRSPRAFAPGTRMAFGGIADPQDRADLLVFMNGRGGSLTLPEPRPAR